MPYNNLGDLQSLTLADGVECDNPCCILTLDCIVELMGNMTIQGYTANTAIATLPESMCPVEDTSIPVYLDSSLVRLNINNNGELKVNANIDSGTLFTNGLSFNVCGRYYNSTIGNNFSQGTSPLRYEGDGY